MKKPKLSRHEIRLRSLEKRMMKIQAETILSIVRRFCLETGSPRFLTQREQAALRREIREVLS